MALVREGGSELEPARMTDESSSFRCCSFVAAIGAVEPKLANFVASYQSQIPWRLEMEASLYRKVVGVVLHRPLVNLDSVQRSSWMENKVVVQSSSDTNLPLTVPNCTGRKTRGFAVLASIPWLVDM